MRVARNLADQGLRLDPGFGLQIVTGGEVVLCDPVLPGDNPYSRTRNSLRLMGHFSDDYLIAKTTSFARESIRRKAMHQAYNKAQKQNCHAPGWTVLAHPVAIALLARIGVPLEFHPGNKSKNMPNSMQPKVGSYESERAWDLLSIKLGATIRGTYIWVETKPGEAWLQIDGQYPETVTDALHGKPITAVLGIPPRARYGVADIIRRHALALDKAIADSRIANVTNMGSHISIELDPMVWLPFGYPPDEETEKLLALNEERH